MMVIVMMSTLSSGTAKAIWNIFMYCLSKSWKHYLSTWCPTCIQREWQTWQNQFSMDAVKHGGCFSRRRLSYCENKTTHVSCAQTRNCPKNWGSDGKNMQLSISSPFLPRFQEKRTRRRIVVQKSSYLPETITFLRAFKWMRYMSNDFSAVSGTNPE